MGPVLLDTGWRQFEGSANRIAASVFLKKPIDVSHKLPVFVLQSKIFNTLDFKSCLNKEMLVNFYY
jgi:hypothetical protein